MVSLDPFSPRPGAVSVLSLLGPTEADQKARTAITRPVRIKIILLIVAGKPKKFIRITHNPKIPLTQFCHMPKIKEFTKFLKKFCERL